MINKNRFKEKVTIDDVARLAGVSKSTVSFVLNNRPSISVSTRDRVREVIRKLNYQPNQIARSLSSRQTRSIGLIVKQIDNPYFTKIMRGVFEYFSGCGYTVLLGSSELQPAREKSSIEALLRQRVDGLILSPLQGSDADLSHFSVISQNQVPLVLLEKVANVAANVVDIRNERAACEAVTYLIGLGHRRIAYYSGPDYSMHNRERLTGYRKAMMENGLPAPSSCIRQAGVYLEDGYAAARAQFTEPGERPTAVFCFNDLVAIGVMNALMDLCIHIPDDVSVIGFDDIEFCGSVRVPLSSIRVPAFEMGKAAAELLMNQISRTDSDIRKTVELEATLIPRASCARVDGRAAPGSMKKKHASPDGL
jgi:LacI family transcriptional regulator